MARELFRFIRGETPTLDDFKANGALGKRMRWNQDDPDAVRRWNDGVSIFDDFERACELASNARFGWIATITVEESAGHEVSQYGRDRLHYTIFGEQEELLALVSVVCPVSEAPSE